MICGVVSHLFLGLKKTGTVGRPATPYRRIFDVILYVLRTGCQWQAIPREKYAPGSTVHGRFRQWVQAGVFEKAWKVLLEYYDQQVGIDWKWQAMDCAMTKAPLGGEATGPSPVDRGKSGTKRSVLTDRRGAPISVVVTAANTHDKKVALSTIDNIIVERSEKVVYRLHHLCLDKGYDYEDVIV
jgi:putative transposase